MNFHTFQETKLNPKGWNIIAIACNDPMIGDCTLSQNFAQSQLPFRLGDLFQAGAAITFQSEKTQQHLTMFKAWTSFLGGFTIYFHSALKDAMLSYHNLAGAHSYFPFLNYEHRDVITGTKANINENANAFSL